MVVMQVDPESKEDPILRELANAALVTLDRLLGYLDVIPPKVTKARQRSIETARNALEDYRD